MTSCPSAEAPTGPWPWQQLWHGPATQAGWPWPDFDRAALDALLWTAGPLLAGDAWLTSPERRESFPRREGTRLREWLRSGFLRGQTVVVDRLEHHTPPVAAWARALGDAVGAEAEVSAVLTPAQASGYPLHRDASDVLVFQLQGRKHWRCHPGEPRRAGQVEVLGPGSLATPPLHLTLAAGECLLVPAGVPHEAHTGPEASLHLTVSLRGYRWLDLLLDLARAAARHDDTLRSSASADTAVRAVQRFLQAAPAARATALHECARRALQTPPPLAGGALTGPDTTFDLAGTWRLPAHARLLVEAGATGVTLACNGRVATRLRAAPALEPTLRWVAGRSSPFSAADLPPWLPYEQQCELLRQLAAEGVIEPAA